MLTLARLVTLGGLIALGGPAFAQVETPTLRHVAAVGPAMSTAPDALALATRGAVLVHVPPDAEQGPHAVKHHLLEHDPNAPVLGNPDGDVTVVEFTDYNDPVSRAIQPEVAQLLEADPGVRLLIREWPTLGGPSEIAARAALAARAQGAYSVLHGAFLGLEPDVPADDRPALTLAQVLGLDVEQLYRDMASSEVEEHLAASAQLAEALHLSAQPSFVIGDMVLHGAPNRGELMAAVEAARNAKAE